MKILRMYLYILWFVQDHILCEEFHSSLITSFIWTITSQGHTIWKISNYQLVESKSFLVFVMCKYVTKYSGLFLVKVDENIWQIIASQPLWYWFEYKYDKCITFRLIFRISFDICMDSVSAIYCNNTTFLKYSQKTPSSPILSQITSYCFTRSKCHAM